MRSHPLPPRSARVLFSAWVLALLTATGCGSDSSPVSPGIDPEIVNVTDNFQFQVSNVQNYTGSWEYSWTNTGNLAVVDHSSAVTNGSATLTLVDSNGGEVYTRDLAVDGSYTSSAGQSGNWTVRVALNGASGTFNFRVDKATP